MESTLRRNLGTQDNDISSIKKCDGRIITRVSADERESESLTKGKIDGYPCSIDIYKYVCIYVYIYT